MLSAGMRRRRSGSLNKLWTIFIIQEIELNKSVWYREEEMNISKRSVYYDIRKINEWMEAQHLSELVVERKKGIRIDDEQKAMIRAGLKMIPSELAYVFTPTERVKIIICSILQRNRNLFLDDFMDFCQVQIIFQSLLMVKLLNLNYY